MSTPTRLTSGVATAPASETLGSFLAPDPTNVISYFNDFHVYAAGDWTITGSPTATLTDARGGVLQATAANTTDNTVTVFQLVKESFQIAAGYKAWFKTRIKQAVASAGDMFVGLCIIDTSPIASAPTDGIWFRKDDGDANVDFVVRVDAADAVAAAAITTLATDTYLTLGFYYDGASTVRVYVADVEVYSTTLTAAQLAALDDEPLTLTFAWQNASDTVAHIGSVDYVFAAIER